MTDNPIALVSPVWTYLSDVVVERAEGVYVYTPDGQCSIDQALEVFGRTLADEIS